MRFGKNTPVDMGDDVSDGYGSEASQYPKDMKSENYRRGVLQEMSSGPNGLPLKL